VVRKPNSSSNSSLIICSTSFMGVKRPFVSDKSIAEYKDITRWASLKTRLDF